MVIGAPGVPGGAVQNHVVLAQEQDQGPATILQQEMEENTAPDQAARQELATQEVVQVSLSFTYWFQDLSAFIIFSLSVVLITGGRNLNHGSAEIYNPLTKTSCSLPSLPHPHYYYHTQDGGLTCGGRNTYLYCVTWNPAHGNWVRTHKDMKRKRNHVSWATASGVYLMGGAYYPTNTEKAMKERPGRPSPAFNLQYNTM